MEYFINIYILNKDRKEKKTWHSNIDIYIQMHHSTNSTSKHIAI